MSVPSELTQKSRKNTNLQRLNVKNGENILLNDKMPDTDFERQFY
jgi:hypothetical protein